MLRYSFGVVMKHQALVLSTFCLLAALATELLQAQPDERIDPKSPQLATLPEVGRMVGTAPHASRYGRHIAPLSDINNDGLADWCVSAVRTDTTLSPRPVDLLVYKGVAGKLPAVTSGQRIGPSELASNTRFLAAGDWDADGWKDIAVRIEIHDDTSGGNTEGRNVGIVAVFWGRLSGYSLSDTTRLSNGEQMWFGPNGCLSYDITQDNVDDLVVWGVFGMTNGKVIAKPALSIYRGHRGKRWGRDGVARTADWGWWNPPTFRRMYSIDQNCDNIPDLVLPWDDEDVVTAGQLSILYGTPTGDIPDTSSIVTLDLKPVNGHNALLSDVTGDGTPELLVVTMDETVRIYAGEPGVRLLEQFGTGNDPEDVEHGRWYRRPWAELPLPHKLDDAFALSGESPLFTLGDAGLNGTNDIWVYSSPFIISYSTGKHGECLDSLFDGIIYPAGEAPLVAVFLGDIDSSGVPTIAIGFDIADVVQFVKPTRNVLEDYCVHRTPLHGDALHCGNVSEVTTRDDIAATGLHLLALPNPATGQVTLRWDTEPRMIGSATITIHDERGQAVATFTPPATDGSLLWDASSLGAGHYFITLTIARRSTTTHLLLQR
jgi:hypothetical protein